MSIGRIQVTELFSPASGKDGMTDLHYAAYCGDAELLSHCLKNGMHPNQRDEYRGYTALHWLADMAAAAGGDRALMAEELLRYGADQELKCNDGQTARQIALEASGQGDDIAAVLDRGKCT
jgi:ankyrin repeat protein